MYGYAVPGDAPERDPNPPSERTPWRFRDHEGRGEILTMLEGPENDPIAPAGWPEAQKRALDEAFDAGFRCGTDVHRCELRAARDLRDAIAATRAFRLQVSIVVAICVVVLCSTLLIVKG